ncbi:MAG: transporter substrate-binding domain-containing protein [Desulfotignum sp.]|nr:transporter substrate-binding domain-containing protein [Desulfotignum sp.]MCF8125625.1 transporter substrate-binding domain-containing protein [Desulfotignum sp.]
MAASCILLVSDVCVSGARTRVKIGVYQNAPKVFMDDTGTPSGIFMDIIKEIAAKENWELQFIPGTWGEGLDRLKQNKIDLMPDVAYTAERETRFAFHRVPVLSDWFQVYTRKNSGISSIVDLAGKKVLVLERSVQETAFKQMARGFGFDFTLMPFPDYQSIFDTVAKGEADAAVTNRFNGMMFARPAGLQDTAIIFNPTRLYFAAPAGGRKYLLDTVDRYLVQFKNDPDSIYYRSLKKWTDEKVHVFLPAWAKLLGLVIGIALAMSLVGSFLLKRVVDIRTRQLRKINREMEDRIKDRTAELAAAMEQAKAADYLKSAFLATMSHELRTPLNSIIGFTGILLQGLAGQLNQEQQKQLGMVQTSSRHLLALINDVLDISKIEAGQLSLSLSTFDLRASIEKTVHLVKPLAEKKGLDLTLEVGGAVGEVTSDQRRLEQIILNLLNNAVKFTEKGSIHVTCRVDGTHYELAVSDTGIGIDPDDIPDLFQPFHQIDAGLSRKREGTGLGLSICKKLILLMGGSINVKSCVSQGSTFTIRFQKSQEPDHGG